MATAPATQSLKVSSKQCQLCFRSSKLMIRKSQCVVTGDGAVGKVDFRNSDLRDKMLITDDRHACLYHTQQMRFRENTFLQCKHPDTNVVST